MHSLPRDGSEFLQYLCASTALPLGKRRFMILLSYFCTSSSKWMN